MGSINRSHIETDGGVLLFSGEIVLLYIETVNCEVEGRGSFKGRLLLTTHRLITTVNPYRQDAPIKSLSAPFAAIVKCSVEQPIFGANYIEATVRDETDRNKTFSFKLKFPKGGAIEIAMTMNRAVARVGQVQQSQPMAQPPPTYNPSPAAQYYQAPPNVYAPGYNCGVQVPVQQFPEQPPIGFIYASSAPPPYPGLATPGANPQQAPYGAQPSQQQPPPAYNQQSPYPNAQYPSGMQPEAPPPSDIYPQAASGYPQQPGVQYPQATQASGHQYPGQYPQTGPVPTAQQPTSGYPFPQNQQQQPPQAGSYVGGSTSGYPTQQPGNNAPAPPPAGSWPTAPAYNPNYSENKKNV